MVSLLEDVVFFDPWTDKIRVNELCKKINGSYYYHRKNGLKGQKHEQLYVLD